MFRRGNQRAFQQPVHIAVTAGSLRAILWNVVDLPAFFRALLRGGNNGAARVMDLAVHISRGKVGAAPEMCESELHAAAGVVVGALY